MIESILILDDDEVVRDSLKAYFEDRGWKVFAVHSAEAAIELLRKETPDCAVVDIRLPGMNGNSFLLEIKETHPEMACVICTGSPQYHQPEEVLRMSQVSKRVFSKPVSDLQILENEIIEHHSLLREKAGKHS